jgi:hypothetical protein
MKSEKKKKEKFSIDFWVLLRIMGARFFFQCCEVAGQGDHWKST